jgi:phage virion morphogenesis protein
MAGAGIEVSLDSEYNQILAEMERASKPDLKAIGAFVAGELKDVSNQAFQDQADPATGAKWEDTARRRLGLVSRILWDHGHLMGSVEDHGQNDGSAIIGSNLVYARIHQEGGKTSPHEIKAKPGKALYFNGRFAKRVRHPGSEITARPYMGVPKDFDRRILDDPYIQGLLGRFV